ncbi:amidase [Leucobacter tardus]|uniref:Amidase n=1 Tax=Leucobacter tardus TaxID=501483 RepID=A0A939QGV8_9MICO|nr:amidase [Leucobacter tardus]
MPRRFSVVEATIDDLHDALAVGATTSVELVARYLNRVAAFDRSGPRLNAMTTVNPRAFEEARDSDIRRASGCPLGPLDGIPFTAKDSYCVTGLPVAAGSPAFEKLIAQYDAFAVQQLREAGAVFLGLTNMPPMAAGGMQRGLSGRAESPYHPDYLTSAFGSGSSNGSGTATAASFAAFGLGEETWSSGRAPASNNSLVAYTPSRGMISVRGNWPLVPTMDVVVPHTRSVTDLKHVLDVLLVDDPEAAGDFWRTQPFVPIPAPSTVVNESPSQIPDLPLAGVRFAVPRIYVNGDPDSTYPIDTRDSVIQLWREMCEDLERAGAEVIETSFPVVDNYEGLHPGDPSISDRGWVSDAFLRDEIGALSVWAMDDFLQRNGDPQLCRLKDVEASRVFPAPTGSLPDRFGVFDFDIAYDIADYVDRAADGVVSWQDIGSLEHGVRGLERTRQVDFESWLTEHKFDAVIFPSAADVGPSDADTNPASADLAWKNGVWVSNGNLVPRHLGIPTVTLPLGIMRDTRMPVGLTIAGAAYADVRLVQVASAIERMRVRRGVPQRTPELDEEQVFADAVAARPGAVAVQCDTVTVTSDDQRTVVGITAHVVGGTAAECAVFVDGVRVPASLEANRISGDVVSDAGRYEHRHSEWRPAYGPLVVVVVRSAEGAVAGTVATSSGSPL